MLLAALLFLAADPRFEVAAIKPAPPDQWNGSSGIKTGNGRMDAVNVTLKRCIMGAWGVGPHQIAGGPAWLDTERFEIAAKAADAAAGDAEIMRMLRVLLAERFGLAVHTETRTMPVLALEVAKGGPKLRASAGGGGSTQSGRGVIDARGTTMAHLAEVLGRGMEAPVVDRTGLTGTYDLKLEWTPESRSAEPGSGPSLYTAIQEQLGLVLRARKQPMEVLVIDRAERPTEN